MPCWSFIVYALPRDDEQDMLALPCDDDNLLRLESSATMPPRAFTFIYLRGAIVAPRFATPRRSARCLLKARRLRAAFPRELPALVARAAISRATL